MKKYILKREQIFHLLSLVLIAVSLFLKEPLEKIVVLLAGILGLLIIATVKKQKILIVIYVILLIAAVIFSYIRANQIINI